jgi:alkanesulfonate monooxygenase SsuD/methylene tetrahydromethanopterin reductase-like flavin-dependent oxidoreductase (luciferase family)
MAGFTERIRLGTGILVLPLRNPLILGRQLITIQDLSDGRLILGTGIGDYPPDFQAMGVTYEARAAIFEDYLEALRKILGGGSVSHHGQFVHFDDAQFYPRVDPPPILVGGGVIAVPEPNDDRLAMRVLRRVARLGDGWMPDWGRPDVIERGVRTIRQLAQSYGRENPNLQITFSTKLYLADTDEEAQRKTHLSLEFAHQEANIVAKFGTRTPTKALTMSLIGSSKSLVKQIEEYGRAGVTCFKMAAMTSDLESLFCMMERFAKEIVPCF